MPSKNLALGACLLIIGTASAHNKTYTVHKGDTIGAIAKRFNVPASKLIESNTLKHKYLVAGMKLQIPGSKKNETKSSASDYTIRSGDTDWAVAHRLGITVAQLRSLNPHANWHDLQIGDSLRVPTCGNSANESPKLRSHYAVVTGDHATIRRGPGTDAEMVAQVDTGTKVAVLGFEGGWYKLKFPKGTVGWMRGDLLKAAQTEKAAHYDRRASMAAKEAKRKQRYAERVAHTKTVHTLAASYREWAAPVEIDGDEAPMADKLLAGARRLLGTRYVYGGLSSRGLDCSGFTTTVFRAAGIKLPRTSRSQSTIGVPISRNELKPGDLVFFRTGRSRRINHVGIYCGNGRFIHASSGYGAVREDSLSGHYGGELAAARRLPAVRHVVEAETVSSADCPPTKKAASVPDSTVPAPMVEARQKVKPDPVQIPPPAPVIPKKPVVQEEDKSGH